MRGRLTSRPPHIRLYEDEAIIDGFAGGGGASTGIEMALGRSPDVAINHDPIALAMHEANHPETAHIVSNIRAVRYEDLLPGRRVGLLWLSPDCTFHSKARGGKPFREPTKARRIRGLAWEAVRAVKALGPRAPRVIMLENVEEWRDWCPLKGDVPDWTRKGENYRRWKRELAKAGTQAFGRPYVIEDRELVASHYGAPTKRKRLFVVARIDGQPIVWPEPTHGPGRAPYRTAAECLDFTLPVPSIFLTQPQANAWARAMGLPKSSAPRRPLAAATKRRIARGVQRFVLDCPEPFIVKYHGERHHVGAITVDGAEFRGQALDEPIATLDTSNRFGLVQPVLAPFITEHANASAQRNMPADEPLRTICAQVKGGHFALVAPMLINTRNGERGGIGDHPNTTQDLRKPLPTQTAGGTHYAEVRITLVEKESIDAIYVDRAVQTCAFLVKYFGTGVARPLDQPLGTLTTKDRVGLVQVVLMRIGDQEWVLADIGMRMLTPRELFLCQGFPATYQIEHVPVLEDGQLFKGRQKLTKKAQTRLVGNSVPPHVAAALIAANLARPAEAVA